MIVPPFHLFRLNLTLAGTIGALGNNGQGVVGVFDDATEFRFHIAKGLSDSGSGSGELV